MTERDSEPTAFREPMSVIDRRAGRTALERLGGVIDGLLARTGLDGDDVARELLAGRASDDAYAKPDQIRSRSLTE